MFCTLARTLKDSLLRNGRGNGPDTGHSLMDRPLMNATEFQSIKECSSQLFLNGLPKFQSISECQVDSQCHSESPPLPLMIPPHHGSKGPFRDIHNPLSICGEIKIYDI